MDYANVSAHVNFNELKDPGNRFELHDVIGEGTYGEVFAAKDKHTSKWVAIKVLENIGDNIEEIEEEYLVLRDLCLHPNIPAFHGLYLKRPSHGEDDQLWFVMELCSGGSVTDLVNGLQKVNRCLSEEQIAYILRETIDALCYLHANHCMHRDVKGHNILLTDDAYVKLVDFGVSSHLAATMGRRNTSVGTPYWMAPEVIACEQQYDYSYDVRCDVWSVGITAIELADGNPPLADLHPMRALFQIPRNPPPTLRNPNKWSEEFNDFLAECLVKDFEERPVARELMEHSFIKQIYGEQEFIRRQLKDIIVDLRSRGKLAKRAHEVTTKHGKLKSNRKSRHQPMFVDDLAALENLTEEIVLEQLYQRYGRDQIYTYIGDILLAVNPFQDPGLYTPEHSVRYRNRARSSNPPHIFAVADSAYHAMLHHLQNQCIVISGESGAGKTESANLLLKQFVALGKCNAYVTPTNKAQNRNLEDKILQVNPIMEAFGNARTGINDNSSRFGKFLELSFTKSGKVTGAKVHVYLLEHSRVVFQTSGETNFHIFTCLYNGLERKSLLKFYHLDASHKHSHKYLGRNGSVPTSVPKAEWKNCSRFDTVSTGFKLLGFTADDTDAIYRILAAVLNLGDLVFGEKISEDNTEASVVVNCNVLVSDLLAISPEALNDALTSNSVVTKGEIIHRHNCVTEAVNTRDAMAKALYGRLFDWIVYRINKLLSVDKLSVGDALGIGILDIFGFENFDKNSFEQMCINIANEQLQYYFNQHVFTWEQQEYMSEGIEVDIIEFCDNRPVLDLFLAKPVGLLALLDEESHFPKSTDASLVEKFHNNIKSPFYRRPKSSSLLFTVQHYAGSVTYNADNFLDKNRNFLPLEVVQTLRQSKYEIVRSQFQSPLTKTGNLYPATSKNSDGSINMSSTCWKTGVFGSSCKTKDLASQTRAQQTSATYFRYSLMDLLQKMVHGAPHFVRCIKPNSQRSPNAFHRLSVRTQLAYAGVLEAVRIRQQGYSHRFTFGDFMKRYHCLVFGYDERIVVSRDSCRLLLLRLKLDGWALGKTKVFLKYYHVEYLSRRYESYVRKVILVQSCIRRWLAKVAVKQELWKKAESALTLQKYTRGWLARKKIVELQAKFTEPCSKTAVVPGKAPKRAAPQPPRGAKEDCALVDNTVEQRAAVLIQKWYRRWHAHRNVSDLHTNNKNSVYHLPETTACTPQVRSNNQELCLRHKKQHRPTSNIPVPSVSSSHAIVSGQHRGGQTPQKLPMKKRNAPKAPTEAETDHYYDNLQQQMPSKSRLVPFGNPQMSHLQNSQQHNNKLSARNGLDARKLHHPAGLSSNKQAVIPTPAKRPTVHVSSWGKPWDAATAAQPPNGVGPLPPLTNIANSNLMSAAPDSKLSSGDKCIQPAGEPVTYDFKSFLRKVGPPPLTSDGGLVNLRQLAKQSAVGEEDVGPYNFKKLLRKTNFAPTESLRRRRGIPTDSPSPSRPVALPRGRAPVAPAAPQSTSAASSPPMPPPRSTGRPTSAVVNSNQLFAVAHQRIQVVGQAYNL